MNPYSFEAWSNCVDMVVQASVSGNLHEIETAGAIYRDLADQLIRGADDPLEYAI